MEQRYMVTEGLGRLMRKFSLPCVVSLLVASVGYVPSSFM